MLPLAVLVGGLGTRLGTLTEDVPKCLIEINGRPFVDWQLDLLISSGFLDFVFCVSHKSEMIQNYLENGSTRGINIKYSMDGETQLGTGGAIQKAIPQLGENFGVIYGDSYLPINYAEVENRFLFSKSRALMTVYENLNKLDTSNVEFTRGKLVNYEKGARDENMKYIDYGITYFQADAFRSWTEHTEFDLSSVCHELAVNGQLDGFEVTERFYEIGSLQGIRDLSDHLRKVTK